MNATQRALCSLDNATIQNHLTVKWQCYPLYHPWSKTITRLNILLIIIIIITDNLTTHTILCSIFLSGLCLLRAAPRYSYSTRLMMHLARTHDERGIHGVTNDKWKWAEHFHIWTLCLLRAVLHGWGLHCVSRREIITVWAKRGQGRSSHCSHTHMHRYGLNINKCPQWAFIWYETSKAKHILM